MKNTRALWGQAFSMPTTATVNAGRVPPRSQLNVVDAYRLMKTSGPEISPMWCFLQWLFPVAGVIIAARYRCSCISFFKSGTQDATLSSDTWSKGCERAGAGAGMDSKAPNIKRLCNGDIPFTKQNHYMLKKPNILFFVIFPGHLYFLRLPLSRFSSWEFWLSKDSSLAPAAIVNILIIITSLILFTCF